MPRHASVQTIIFPVVQYVNFKREILWGGFYGASSPTSSGGLYGYGKTCWQCMTAFALSPAAQAGLPTLPITRR